jgi:hypothetical protein
MCRVKLPYVSTVIGNDIFRIGLIPSEARLW